MPHVTVHFDPTKIDQTRIDLLKSKLPQIVADALSELANDHNKQRVPKNEIFVRQQAAHETDVNPSSVEILVEAGRSKGRDPDRVKYYIARAVRKELIIPSTLLGPGRSCVWVKFCEENGFGFIRPYDA